MANWALPTLADLKVDVLDMLKQREVDAITLAESPLNPPVGAVRWNRTLSRFQSWNGTAWVDMIIGMAGGGTGATNPGDFLTNFGLGTMSTQNSNAVNITGGSITGLTTLSTLGNLTVSGIIVAGSAPIAITDSSGRIQEAAIADGTIYARVAAAETISAVWTHTAELHAYKSIRILPTGAGGSLERITIADGTNSQAPAVIQAIEPGVSVNNVIFSNNYWGTSGSASGRVNTATGGSFLRLGLNAAVICGINTSGGISDLLVLGPTINVSAPAALQVAASLSPSELRMSGNGTNTISFYVSGTTNGKITQTGNALYYDQNTHYWRTTNGTVSLAVLDVNGRFAATGGLQTLNGNIYDNGPNLKLTLSGAVSYYLSDYHYFVNLANNKPLATIDPNGGLTLPSANAEFVLAGTQSTGIRMFKVGPASYLDFIPAAGTSYIRTIGGGMGIELSSGGNIVAPGGFQAPSGGSGVSAAYRFTGNFNSGLYFNTTNNTMEVGATFDNNSGRAVMRCYANAGVVDFLLAGALPLRLETTAVKIGQSGHYISTIHYGEDYPGVHHGYNCGLPSNAWYGIYSLNPLTITSDIRLKEVHGPLTNVLDVVDSIQPFIASFRKEFQPEENIDEHWSQRFPSFSAQEIQEKIDAKFGTRIVNDTNPDSLGMSEGRLMPIMWQAIRELYAKIKALES